MRPAAGLILRRTVLEGIFFLFLALASTWPLARHAHDHLPLGTEEAPTVPLFNVWTVWWNADRAAEGFRGYWQAPIFHPAGNAFAFSEPMPLSVSAAPIILLGGNRILAYNCLLLFSLWLNGWVACRLLRRLPMHPALPWLGGAMTTLLPLVHAWLGVLQLVPVFGILLAISALYRFARRPAAGRGVMLGGALALTYLLCSYYGLFLTVTLAASGAFLLGRRLLRWRTWTALLPGALVCLLLCLPVIVAQQRSLAAAGMHYDLAYLSLLSAKPADYLAAPWQQMFQPGGSPAAGQVGAFKLCPGFLKIGLALFGAAFGLLRPGRRRWTLFCLAMALSSFLLSMGPLLQVGEARPYLLLAEFFPGVAQIRNVFRFAIVTQLMTVLLAVSGLQAGMAITRRCTVGGKIWKAIRAAIVATGILAATEILPPAQPLHAPPDFSTSHSWLAWLKKETNERAIIACIPFPLKPDVASYRQEAEWMNWQTFHGRRMVNGYSGYFPEHFRQLKWPMAQFPAKATISALMEMGVEYCVVKSDSPQGRFIRATYHDRLEAVFRNGPAHIDIYRLRAESETGDTPGRSLRHKVVEE